MKKKSEKERVKEMGDEELVSCFMIAQHRAQSAWEGPYDRDAGDIRMWARQADLYRGEILRRMKQ